ncbi:MAG TPA: anthranilate phosphoribosyltransferase, partial [Sulfuricurvum sp.]|nr:anthranilate phosphoribosyltransferase [Sulfuricurvum sp.]
MNLIKKDFETLFEHQMSDEQMRDFLLSLTLDKNTSSSMIAIAAEVMREHSLKLSVSPDLAHKLIDVVGTGGDKSGSFNVSSTVSV